MGKKDLAEKKLEEYNDVFADIFNTLLFEKNVIDPEQLKASGTAALYKTDDGNLKEQFRDTLKEYQNCKQYAVAFYGVENQSAYDATMPVRVMGYDYGSYKQQILEGKWPICPVITIVLNFSNVRWTKNKSLYEMMGLSEEEAFYVQKYQITVFDIAYLEDDVIEKFQSDFKPVARFFKDKRLKKRVFTEDRTEIKHADAVAELLSAFTGDEKYRHAIPYIHKKQEKGEGITMCWVIESYINDGKIEEACSNARMFFKNGASFDLVARSIQSISREEIQKIYDEVQAERV